MKEFKRKWMLDRFEKLSIDKQIMIKEYLRKRFSNYEKRNTLNVVFDLLHGCNLQCIGCGTEAIKNTCSYSRVSFDDAKYVLDKIKRYSNEKKETISIVFGGGEPLLHPDLVNIVKYASKLFSPENVGLDTNGSIPDATLILEEILPYVGYIGISVNGLKDKHNFWANVNYDVFSATISTIQNICKTKEGRSKLEVTTVAYTTVLDEITDLMDYLYNLGVLNYSVHRAMPVGRLSNQVSKLVPSSYQYFDCFCEMIPYAQHLNMNAHFHHSIEEVYASNIAGIDTYFTGKVVGANERGAIGIKPDGTVIMNPWCNGGIWEMYVLGNLMIKTENLATCLAKSEPLVKQLIEASNIKNRCHGCQAKCSGGSRIVAALYYLNKNRNSELFEALSEVDPICMEGDD